MPGRRDLDLDLRAFGPRKNQELDVSTSVFKRVDYTLDILLGGIAMGTTGLPDLQRPFVWKAVQVRDLFDSMYQGYPVGHLLLWKAPKAETDSSHGVGAVAHQKSPELLILDGQQRLTSLYSVLHGTKVLDKDFKEYRIELAFNPLTEKFVVPDATTRKNPEFIPDISEVWISPDGLHEFINNYLDRLRVAHPATKDEEKRIAENINQLSSLEKFPFVGLELSETLSEEKAADIFVRTNSEGVTLKQADFILTLMSVFDEKGRRSLEAFSKDAKVPSVTMASPFNYFLQPSPDQLLRVAAGVGFMRGRMQYVYGMLRGKDMETSETSPEIRDKQFALLADAQAQVLDLNSWHEFFKSILAAGFSSGRVISSENTILYSYILFLLGRNRFDVDHVRLRRTIARWFFMSSLTGRYTSSPETTIEEDLARLRELRNADDFVGVLDRELAAALPNDFWTVQLPNELASSASRGPSLFAFYAAQKLLSAPVLFSTLLVAEMLDPATKAKKSAVERHHLFPQAYLSTLGLAQRDINQIANYTLVEWADNIDISDEPPTSYVPDYEVKLTTTYGAQTLADQYEVHALWNGWETETYVDFLAKRRSRMAWVIRQGFEKI